MDAASAVTLARSYAPYGEELIRSGTGFTNYGFGGEWVSSSLEAGLIYLRARWYAPYLNQFIQPDTIVPHVGHPPSLNRYVYVNNNPINFTDPSGHCIGVLVGVDTLACVVFIGGVAIVVYIVAIPAGHYITSTFCMTSTFCVFGA